MSKLQATLEQFSKAIKRLGDVLSQEENEFIRDSAIQRFEFSFDLAWKTIKAYGEEEGFVCATPRSCFREAFNKKLIEYDDFWMEMIKMRNLTSHTYIETVAKRVFEQLPTALAHFKALADKLANILDRN